MSVHLKLAFRNILKQKVGSLINIFGLSVSLAVCLIIVLFVQYELSFDKFNANYNQIVRLLDVDKDGRCPDHPVVFNQILEKNIPELKNGTMLFYYNKSTDFFRHNNNDHVFNKLVFTSNSFFDIFTVEFVKGTPDNALDAPNKIVITESNAQKLFGKSNPLGQILKYENKYDFEVSGVIKDLPVTSHFQVDLLAPIEAQNEINPYMMESWNMASTSFYFKLPANTNINSLEQKIEELHKTSLPNNYNQSESKFTLQPLSKIHLYSSDTIWDSAIRGDIQVIFAFCLIALLVVCIACFNYINLSMALLAKRNYYTGIQKTMGADRRSILTSTFTESLFIVFICAVCAVFISMILIPGFNMIMGTNLFFSMSNWVAIAVLLILIFITVTIVSLYQAWSLARVNPVHMLSGKAAKFLHHTKKSSSKFSQTLTIAQLGISIVLIIAVITINKQTSLVLDKKLGFNKSQLITINNPWDKNVHKRFNLFKDQLNRMAEVKGVSASWNVPGEYINNYGGIELVNQKPEISMNFGQLPVNVDFFKVLETKFILGRDFQPNQSSDSNKIIINKIGMETLGLENPIGEKLINSFDGKGQSYEIIGVIDNIQYRSLKERGKPVIYYLSNYGLNKVLVRLHQGEIEQSIKKIERVWNSIETNYPFEYEFIDAKIQSNYDKEIRTRAILSIMAFLAVAISMLGILGLVILTTQNRIKEIGIRKVTGAKVTEIITMLNKDFIKWVAIAFVIACPIAYYAMQKWLENFAYKTTISWWIFALAGCIALFIALLTVSWQTFKAARRNPIEALRYE
ncbi:MAG: ABC transporter permease [Salinivirgaceae bacterium]|nr:ABC transporter permease [Salinivirgaceae bacterium]